MTTNEVLAIALKALKKGGGGGGTSNYNDLVNLPQINGVTIQGDKTAEDFGITDASEMISVYFDALQPYSVGDIVIYEGELYEFVADHVAGDPWDATEVDERTVIDIIEESKAEELTAAQISSLIALLS